MAIQFIGQALILSMLVNLGYQQHLADTDGDNSMFYYHQSEYPKDCKEIQSQCSDPTDISNGVYIIKPEGLPEPIEVFCDQTTDEGGWTVIQRRLDGSIDFDRDFDSYTRGFGFLNHEFWLGNNNTAYLTNQKVYELRIFMTDNRNRNISVTYNSFRISDENSKFKLVKLDFEGPGTNDMAIQTPTEFRVTFEEASAVCGTSTGGWWVDDCGHANLNAAYPKPISANNKLNWNGVGLKTVEMKVRPRAT